MKKRIAISLAFAILLGIHGVAIAEEPAAVATDTMAAVDPALPTSEPAATVADDAGGTTATETTPGSKFTSRERLLQTLLGQLATPPAGEEPPATNPGEEPVATIDTTTNASGEGQASQQYTTENIPSEQQVAANAPSGGEGSLAEASVAETSSLPADETGNPPSRTERVAAFVDNLTDEQVFALNRSLNNGAGKGLIAEYDMDLLERIVTENFDKKQINALTRAVEEEAKFMSRYEQTGNEKFLLQAEAQKAKFLARVDRFGTSTEPVEDEALRLKTATRLEARQATRLAVADGARNDAARAARIEVKSESKQLAKELARNAAKEEARAMAKAAALDIAKAEAKELAKESARDSARDAAREAAKGVAKEVAKENQKAGIKAKRNS